MAMIVAILMNWHRLSPRELSRKISLVSLFASPKCSRFMHGLDDPRVPIGCLHFFASFLPHGS